MIDGEEFANLTSQDVVRLISSDKLTVASEEKVSNEFFRNQFEFYILIIHFLFRYMKPLCTG